MYGGADYDSTEGEHLRAGEGNASDRYVAILSVGTILPLTFVLWGTGALTIPQSSRELAGAAVRAVQIGGITGVMALGVAAVPRLLARAVVSANPGKKYRTSPPGASGRNEAMDPACQSYQPARRMDRDRGVAGTTPRDQHLANLSAAERELYAFLKSRHIERPPGSRHIELSDLADTLAVANCEPIVTSLVEKGLAVQADERIMWLPRLSAELRKTLGRLTNNEPARNEEAAQRLVDIGLVTVEAGEYRYRWQQRGDEE